VIGDCLALLPAGAATAAIALVVLVASAAWIRLDIRQFAALRATLRALVDEIEAEAADEAAPIRRRPALSQDVQTPFEKDQENG